MDNAFLHSGSDDTEVSNGSAVRILDAPVQLGKMNEDKGHMDEFKSVFLTKKEDNTVSNFLPISLYTSAYKPKHLLLPIVILCALLVRPCYSNEFAQIKFYWAKISHGLSANMY